MQKGLLDDDTLNHWQNIIFIQSPHALRQTFNFDQIESTHEAIK